MGSTDQEERNERNASGGGAVAKSLDTLLGNKKYVKAFCQLGRAW